MITKYCPVCKETKPISEFFSNKARYDGLTAYCRICFRVHVKEYQSSDKGKLMLKKHGRSNYSKNKEKQKARVAVRVALQKELLKKPPECSQCNRQKKLEAHHPDYSKPLSVIWLCRICHTATHGRLVDWSLA